MNIVKIKTKFKILSIVIFVTLLFLLFFCHSANGYKNFKSLPVFKRYFDSLNTQYSKDWALAGAALYCKPELFQYALEHGGNPLTMAEIVSVDNATTQQRWMFLNHESWIKFSPEIFSMTYFYHYIPYEKKHSHENVTDDTFCSCEFISKEDGTVDIGNCRDCSRDTKKAKAKIISYGFFYLDSLLKSCSGQNSNYNDAFEYQYQRESKFPSLDTKKDKYGKFKESAPAYYAVTQEKSLNEYYVLSNFANPDYTKKILEDFPLKKRTAIFFDELLKPEPNKTLIELLLQTGIDLHTRLIDGLSAISYAIVVANDEKKSWLWELIKKLPMTNKKGEFSSITYEQCEDLIIVLLDSKFLNIQEKVESYEQLEQNVLNTISYKDADIYKKLKMKIILDRISHAQQMLQDQNSDEQAETDQREELAFYMNELEIFKRDYRRFQRKGFPY